MKAIKADLESHEESLQVRWSSLVGIRGALIAELDFPRSAVTESSNESWEKALAHLREITLPEYKQQFQHFEEETKSGYTTQVVGKLSFGISQTERILKRANQLLRNVKFGNVSYRFTWTINKDNERFYRMLTDKEFDNARGGLWDTAFYEKHGPIIDEFFDIIKDSRCAGSPAARHDAERRMNELLDYRSYFDFDMKEIRPDGSEISLRKGIGSGSGGEQILPFYVVLFASMASRYRTNRTDASGNTLRTVIIDEAFEKMSDQRAEKLINLIRDLGIQPILVNPSPTRAEMFCRITESGFIHRNIEDRRFEVTHWVG